MSSHRKGLSWVVVAGLVVAGAAWGQEPARVLEVGNPPVDRGIHGPPDNTLDQPPNEVNGFFSDDTCGLCGTGEQSLAENFLVDTGGLGFEVQQLVFWGGYFPTNTANTTDVITVRFFADAGGLPSSTVLCSESGVAPPRSQTGVVIFGVNEWVYTLDLTVPCVLPDGPHWVEIFNSTQANTSGDDWFWETGDIDPDNGLPDSVFSTTVPGTGWLINGGSNLALQLNGIIVPVELQAFTIE